MNETNKTSQAMTGSSNNRARRDTSGSHVPSRRAQKNAQSARNRNRHSSPKDGELRSNAKNQNQADIDQARRDAALGRSVSPTTLDGTPQKDDRSSRRPKKHSKKHVEKNPKKHASKKTTKHVAKSTKKKGARKRGGRGRFGQPQTNAERLLDVTAANGEQNAPKIPPIEKDVMRIIPIGGNEEVGRNCIAIEYGTGGGKSDIIITDIGMQFAEEDMHGIDYIVPNISYFRGKERNIRAVMFTHGHLDHIGAAPVVLKQLGYPTIVARDLTLAMIKKKLEDGNPGGAKNIKAISVKDINKKMTFGAFKAHFFEVDHSIMDCMGIALETPVGTAINLGDWTINHDPAEGGAISYESLNQYAKPRILLLESLSAINTRPPKSEKVMQGNLETLIKEAPGRIIIGTFASQIKRIAGLLEFTEKTGRKVLLEGYSMKTNVEIAKQLGYIKVSDDVFMTPQELGKYPDNKILVLCTGAQGEHNAALNKIVTENHRFIKVQRDDTIVFSSSIIPGNERSIQRLKDNLYRKCDNVIHSDIMDVHMGGHATAQDIETVIKMVDPQYFVPIYANHYMLHEARKRAVEMGFPKGRVAILDNGSILEFSKTGSKIRKEKADTSYVFVDGLGIGDVGQVVLRDRQTLAGDGMFVVNVIVNAKSKKVISQQVTSRGFVFVKDNFETINETKKKVQKIIAQSTSADTKLDWRHVENDIRDQIGEFLFQKTARRPMVLPIIMEA